MREYTKPMVEEEKIELEDIIAASPGGETENGIKNSVDDIWSNKN